MGATRFDDMTFAFFFNRKIVCTSPTIATAGVARYMSDSGPIKAPSEPALTWISLLNKSKPYPTAKTEQKKLLTYSGMYISDPTTYNHGYNAALFFER